MKKTQGSNCFQKGVSWALVASLGLSSMLSLTTPVLATNNQGNGYTQEASKLFQL